MTEKTTAVNAAPAKVHVQVWSGARNARVVDMTDAHKRGKRCRTLRFQGSSRYVGVGAPQIDKDAESFTVGICHFLEHEARELGFDEVRKHLANQIAAARAAGISEWMINLYDESIRAIDAPRKELVAGVAGVWSAGADSEGISLHDLNDVNQWTEITSSQQTNGAAYAIAQKVWPQVQAARTLREASQILSNAGARLHGYCGLD